VSSLVKMLHYFQMRQSINLLGNFYVQNQHNNTLSDSQTDFDRHVKIVMKMQKSM